MLVWLNFDLPLLIHCITQVFFVIVCFIGALRVLF